MTRIVVIHDVEEGRTVAITAAWSTTSVAPMPAMASARSALYSTY